MRRIAIVEDDAVYRKELIEYLRRLEAESGERFRVSEFTDGEDILENYKSDFDIILMDIEMRFMDGMTCAGKIREEDQTVVIIFITNMPQYAIKGYTVGALDYILKPVSYYAFSQSIRRGLERRDQSQKSEMYLSVPVKGGFRKVAASRIRYLEVMDHDLLFHTVDGNIASRGSMREFADRLDPETFFQCNKAFMINLAYVDGMQNNDVFIGKDTIQVSRARKKPLLDALNRYMANL